MDIVAIHVNCPDAEIAEAIAERLLARRLVACANRRPEIVSRYVWKGRVETARETPLVLKTRRSLFERVAEEVRALHPYETPAIVAFEIEAADPRYADWIRTETAPAR